MNKVAEPSGESPCRHYKRILCKFLWGRGMHKLLAKGEIIFCHEIVYPRDIGSPSNDSTIIYPLWWYIGLSCIYYGGPWGWSQKEGTEHHSFHPEDGDIGLHNALQSLAGEELDHLFRTKSHFSTWSLHTQGDQHLQSHLIMALAIPKSHHGFYSKSKSEDSEWSSYDAKGLSN